MQYFAMLLSPSSELRDPAEPAQEDVMAAYRDFHAKAATAIRAGDALAPPQTAVRITGGPDSPTITEGPFAESAEVAGGYYVFQANDLDAAVELARQIPHAKTGVVELWPMVMEFEPRRPLTGADWLALLLDSPSITMPAPGTPEWDAGVAKHGEYGAAAGDHILGGAALHQPSTATTVRVRDGEVLLTDGPFVEGVEVANGFYVLEAADGAEAVKLASMIPATTVELRQLMGISGL
jgi:hypothetical protein